MKFDIAHLSISSWTFENKSPSPSANPDVLADPAIPSTCFRLVSCRLASASPLRAPSLPLGVFELVFDSCRSLKLTPPLPVRSGETAVPLSDAACSPAAPACECSVSRSPSVGLTPLSMQTPCSSSVMAALSRRKTRHLEAHLAKARRRDAKSHWFRTCPTTSSCPCTHSACLRAARQRRVWVDPTRACQGRHIP